MSWRTQRSFSWQRGSIATSVTTIRLSVGRRISITRLPPFLPRSLEKKTRPAANRQSKARAVEDSQPLYEVISDAGQGEVLHGRTGNVVPPTFPFAGQNEIQENLPRRVQLAAWLTTADNPYFASSYVNRLWGYLTGTGLIEPLDDFRAGNPPSNPELLEFLRDEFVNSGFDTQHILKLICKSRTYQLSIATNKFNEDDQLNYSHAKARRLPAEVLFDTIHFVTGAVPEIPGVEAGTRAAALPDAGVKLPSGLLATLGRPARESACECERVNDMQLGSVLALTNGPDLSRAIHDPGNELTKLVESVTNDRELVDQLVMRILNRHASEKEIEIALVALNLVEQDHLQLIQQREQALAEFQRRLPELQRQREKAIARLSAELAEAIARIDPELPQREIEHATELAAAKQQLESYLDHGNGFASWRDRMRMELQWHPLQFSQVETDSKRGFWLQNDRSALFEKKDSSDVYTMLAASDLTGISAVRLELLTDNSLSANGPGLAPNGNLVLTEFQMQIAHPDAPDRWQDVPFISVLANVSQDHYPVSHSIDGQLDGQAGWAIGNNIGQESWATYQLKLPVGFSGGSLLRFKLFQKYDDHHQIGRLRISVSKHHQPAGLGLSESLLAQLVSPESTWSEETKKKLQSAFEKGDAKLLGLRELVAKKQRPLEVSPEIIKLRERLARANRPTPREPKLVQLEKDAAISEKQLANQRLTAAQDFAWALINSPSFLFNR